MRDVLRPLLAAGVFLAASASAAPGYYREPALHGDTLVFVAEGDLWRVAASGGRAQRLTTHPALESQPVISPDGASVAFVANYDGAPDVYEMPLAGGEPRRLTFDGSRVWLSPYTAKGEIVYASEYLVGPGMSRALRSVDPRTGAARDWPLADARELVLDADGGTAWFTRFGLEVSGDHAVGYRGGAMAQLWRWETADRAEATRVAAGLNANISQPMWWQGKVYAVSDANGRANLYLVDGGPVQALTTHRDAHVRGARLDGGRIVYQLGADIYLYDTASASEHRLAIELDSDFVQRRERFIGEPLKYLTGMEVDTKGERVALSARGQVALAGTEALRRIALAVPAHARARAAVPASDGKSVFAIVDVDGRSEIQRFAADGSPAGQVLLGDEGTHRWQLWPSPDGRWLAHADKRARLSLIDLRGGGNRVLDESPYGDDEAYTDVVWSADGRYLAWSRPDSTQQRAQLFVAEAASLRHAVVTSDRYESSSPAFAPDGHWLYFLSDRRFVPTPGAPWGDRNMGALFDKRSQIFALALQDGLRFPFQPLDELAPATDAADASAAKPAEHGKSQRKDKAAPAMALPAIEFDGLAARLHEVGVEAGNFRNLGVTADRLYVLDAAAGSFDKAQLQTVEIKPGQRKVETFMANVRDYRLAANGKRLLVATAGKDVVGEVLLLDVGAKAPAELDRSRVQLEPWQLVVDPVEEWRQMFDDAWRMHRQFSFDPKMRGADWNAVRARLLPLVARVTDRHELDDLLGQMSAELGILHSQVRGGEYRNDPAAPAPAWLGARLAAAGDGVRIEHIYRTDAELPSQRAPLQQPAVNAREGDRIIAVNGRPVTTPGQVALALRAQAGQQVLLELRRDARTLRTVVRPVDAAKDAQLRYGDWVRGNLARVERAGGGRLGYLHLYAMGPNDVANFAREFYAQVERDGLIIDVRRNRGGNIDSWIIEKLLRRVWEFWQPPHGAPTTNMQQTFRGQLVVLADEFTYSDGETFTAAVRALKLAPVIGRHTAGAGVWLSDRNRLADNGLARVAETGQFDLSGRWLVEGSGVAPEIDVENLPWATGHGGDAQLDAAIANLQQRLAAQPVPALRAQPVTPVGVPASDGR